MSKRRIYRRSCKRKHRYPSEHTAAPVARSMRRCGKMVSWYKCKFCGGWHVGRLDRRQKQSLRDKLRNAS